MVGIDLTPFFSNKNKTNSYTIWEQRVRIAMGLKISPNHAIRFYLHAEEFMLGFPSNSDNPFQYDSVKLNLPGTHD